MTDTFDLTRFRDVVIDHIYDDMEEYYGIDRDTDEHVILSPEEAREVHERKMLRLEIINIELERIRGKGKV